MNNGDLVAIPYVLVRIPLAVLKSRVMYRLPDDSLPRVLFDRQVESLDRVMRQMLQPEGQTTTMEDAWRDPTVNPAI